MNERIKELEAQCWETRKHPVSQAAMGDKFNTEKFAELIVRGCLEQIYSVTIDNPTDDWDQGYDSGLNQAAETIKTHFGVEE